MPYEHHRSGCLWACKLVFSGYGLACCRGQPTGSVLLCSTHLITCCPWRACLAGSEQSVSTVVMCWHCPEMMLLCCLPLLPLLLVLLPAVVFLFRFVDPNDPSTVYLSQPAAESQRLQYQPTYAPNYGQDEKYEPMARQH
eukprot:GHRQ01018294.1.p1 GENE.GHRQ01018294.1~~GHRQ01018294.1.p1  ORF type:complete len:140 (+),score=22.14 GHRQ01018294.1:76-495(+)